MAPVISIPPGIWGSQCHHPLSLSILLQILPVLQVHTWKDILPNTFCSSPESGWKADLGMVRPAPGLPLTCTTAWRSAPALSQCLEAPGLVCIAQPRGAFVWCQISWNEMKLLIFHYQSLGLHEAGGPIESTEGVWHPGKMLESSWRDSWSVTMIS